MLRDHAIVETALDDPSPEVARAVAIQVHGSSALKKARLPAFGKVQVLGPRNRLYLLFVATGIPKLA